MRVLIVTVMLLVFGSAHAVEDGKKIKPPRLKYKNGPVCMCTDGLSEKDIRLKRNAKQTTGKYRTTNNPQQLETSRNRDREDE